MAGIVAYTGLMGSGKSYEVVANVLVPALREGRRVVTNIAGLDLDAIKAYVEERGGDIETLGELVAVTNQQVALPGFVPTEKVPSAVVQAGDLLILDEVWRWYATGEKLPPDHMEFFRMHRQYAHPETGRTCDIVLIVQVIGDLQRKVRSVVEKTFVMKKHKDLGMHDRYVVAIYGGNRPAKATLISTHQQKYDQSIFPLYKSHSQSAAAQAVEKDADSRGSVFGSILFKVGIPLSLLAISLGAWQGYKFLHRHDAAPVAANVPAFAQSLPVSGQGATASAQGSRKPDGLSTRWRVVGHYVIRDSLHVLLVDGTGRRRVLVDPPNYRLGAGGIELQLPEGEFATTYTGETMGKAGLNLGMR